MTIVTNLAVLENRYCTTDFYKLVGPLSFFVILFPAACFFVERCVNASYTQHRTCALSRVQDTHKHSEARVMSSNIQDQDFSEFAAWSRLQVIRGNGFQEGRERSLREALQQQWDRRTDKKEYIRNIRYFEEQTLEVAKVRKENDPSKATRNRLARKAKSRCTAVALHSYCHSLQSLQRVQKRRTPRGQTITFAATIRYHDRLLEEAMDEIAESDRVAVEEAVEEMVTLVPDMPDDLKIYITTSYEQLPWEEIQENDVTDREISRQIRTDILNAQDYNDLHLLDWSQKTPPWDIVRSFRSLGRVRCRGHITHGQGFDEEPYARSYMSNEWREYLLFYSNLQPNDRPVPLWAMQAAKARAEMAWDHDNEKGIEPPGNGIYPPEQDHSDLHSTLEQLLQAENKYYHVCSPSMSRLTPPANKATQHRATTLYHAEIQYAVAEHLQEQERRPIPLPAPAAIPESGETEDLLDSGRRALEHAWESELWRMIQTDQEPAADVRATYSLYLKALGLFDGGSTWRNKGRPWLSPEFRAVLEALR